MQDEDGKLGRARKCQVFSPCKEFCLHPKNKSTPLEGLEKGVIGM